MSNKITVTFGIAGIVLVLVPVWCWAIFGISEKIGTAFGVTAMISLFISFMSGIYPED